MEAAPSVSVIMIGRREGPKKALLVPVGRATLYPVCRICHHKLCFRISRLRSRNPLKVRRLFDSSNHTLLPAKGRLVLSKITLTKIFSFLLAFYGFFCFLFFLRMERTGDYLLGCPCDGLDIEIMCIILFLFCRTRPAFEGNTESTGVSNLLDNVTEIVTLLLADCKVVCRLAKTEGRCDWA